MITRFISILLFLPNSPNTTFPLPQIYIQHSNLRVTIMLEIFYRHCNCHGQIMRAKKENCHPAMTYFNNGFAHISNFTELNSIPMLFMTIRSQLILEALSIVNALQILQNLEVPFGPQVKFHKGHLLFFRCCLPPQTLGWRDWRVKDMVILLLVCPWHPVFMCLDECAVNSKKEFPVKQS